VSYETKPIGTDQAEAWDAFVAGHPLGRTWATLAAEKRWRDNGWSLQPVAALTGGVIVAGLTVLTKRLPYTPWAIARIDSLLPAADDVMGSVSALLGAAEQVARERRALEIEARLLLPEDVAVDGVDYGAHIVQGYRGLGYTAVDQFRHTFVLDLRADDETLLKRLTSKCRRDVRKGFREGVTVVNLTDVESLRAFGEAHVRMCRRKALPDQVEAARFDHVLPAFERGYLRLFGAVYEDEPVNMALVDALGMARWEVGASTETLFEKKVPPTGQPLHFGIMQWLRDHGVKYYDMGGAPGREVAKDHPNYPVWRFKKEFGGRYVETIRYHRRTLGLLGGPVMRLVRLSGKLGA